MLPEQEGKIKAVEEMEERSLGLCNLCSAVISDLKLSGPAWDEFISRADKLHSQTRNFVVSFSAFVDAFQRIADIATKSTAGGVSDTKDIGATLTRICLRQRSVESKLKSMDRIFNENILGKLDQEISDWKKNVANLDREYGRNMKEYKRRRNDLKKKVTINLKMHSKFIQSDPRDPKNRDIHRRVNEVFEELSGYYASSSERQKQSLRSALVEERSQFCSFSNYMKPYFDMQVSISDELSRMNELLQILDHQTKDPDISAADIEERITANLAIQKSCSEHRTSGKEGARTRPFGAIESLSRCTRAVADRRKCCSPSLTSLFTVIGRNQVATLNGTNGQLSLLKNPSLSTCITNEVRSKDFYQYDCLKNGLYNLSRDSGFTSQDHFYSSSSKTAYSLCLNNAISNASGSNPSIAPQCIYRKHSGNGDKFIRCPNSKRPLLNSRIFYPPVNLLHHRNDESLDSFDVTMEADESTVCPEKRRNGESLNSLPLPPSNFFDDSSVTCTVNRSKGHSCNQAKVCSDCVVYESPSEQSATYCEERMLPRSRCSTQRGSFLPGYGSRIAANCAALSPGKRNPLLEEIERGVQLRKVQNRPPRMQ